MIITVTLNPALDKTLEVPNFTPGPPAPDRRPGDDARRQGRQRRARDQAPRPAGDRDRPRRAARPAPGSSRRSTTSRSSTPSCGSARSRGRTPRCSIRRPACRPRSTSAARPSPPRSSSCSARSSCTSPRARASACSPAACRAGVEPDVYAELIREVQQARRHDRARHRGRAAAARHAGRARHRLAERARGRGARRPRVQRRRGPRPGGGRDDPAGRRRGDHDGRPTAATPTCSTTGPALYRVSVEEQEARSRIGSGDAFLAGYVAARYGGRTPVECLRFGVACGAESTQHFGAGVIDPAKVDRLLGEVDAERLEIGRRDPLRRTVAFAQIRECRLSSELVAAPSRRLRCDKWK